MIAVECTGTRAVDWYDLAGRGYRYRTVLSVHVLYRTGIHSFAQE